MPIGVDVDVYMAAWPPARGDEQVRDEYRLRLRFRRQAHHENRQRHGVQLPLSGRPAGGTDVGQQQAALHLRFNRPAVRELQRHGVLLRQERTGRRDRPRQLKRRARRDLHLRRMGQSAGHHRLAGRHPRRTEPSALPRIRLRHGNGAVLSAEQVL